MTYKAGSDQVSTRFVARMASFGALAANTYDNTALRPTITADGNGVMANMDGVTPLVGDVVLVKDESDSSDGLYDVTDIGSGGTPFILTRTPYLNKGANVSGVRIAVSEGTLQSDTIWQASVAAGPTGTRTDVVGTHTPVFGKAYALTAATPAIDLPVMRNGATPTAGVWLGTLVGEAFTINDEANFHLPLPPDLNFMVNAVVTVYCFTQAAESSKNLSFNLEILKYSNDADISGTTGTVAIVDQVQPATTTTDFALAFTLTAATYLMGGPAALHMKLTRVAAGSNDPVNEPVMHRVTFGYTTK